MKLRIEIAAPAFYNSGRTLLEEGVSESDLKIWFEKILRDHRETVDGAETEDD